MEEKSQKTKKPGNQSTRQILLVLAKKIKIMDEQNAQLRILVDELEEKIIQLEERVYDAREVGFRSDFDWD